MRREAFPIDRKVWRGITRGKSGDPCSELNQEETESEGRSSSPLEDAGAFTTVIGRECEFMAS